MGDEICEFPDSHESDVTISKLLDETRTIAVVGLSTDASKPSHEVPAYLKNRGYRIVPVHPKADIILGEKVYRTLEDIPFPVDMVEIFRPPSEIPAVVDSAIRIGAKSVWMQKGLASHDAAERARAARITVVQDRCMMLEHRRLKGK